MRPVPTDADRDAALFDLLSAVRAKGSDAENPSAFVAWALGLAEHSASQLFQDLWVLWELGAPRGGYFCEFGACDGRELSNTYLLETMFGWTGILAEPNPQYHAALAEFRHCHISHDCIYSEGGKQVPFLCATRPKLSRMVNVVPTDSHERNGRREAETVVMVNTATLDELLDLYGAPDHIDYLSLDTEGSEYDILKSFSFDRRTIAAITVEHNHTAAREDIYGLLAGLGYERRFTGLSQFDDWYVRRDLLPRGARPRSCARPGMAAPAAELAPAPDPTRPLPRRAEAGDFLGRFREIVLDPLNLLIRRVPDAGVEADGVVTLHNGNLVPRTGQGAYYGDFSDILVINRGVHEPLEEYVFQEVLERLPDTAAMLELGAYWGHYSMWLKQRHPGARTWLVEPDPQRLAAGRDNFARNGFDGTFRQARVGVGDFEVDAFLAETGIAHLDILHSDIQGAEVAMLDGATAALSEGRVDYVFVSTHGERIHEMVMERLGARGYCIEVAADEKHETTSYDGFVFARRPNLAPLFPNWKLLGREDILRAVPERLVSYLQKHLERRRCYRMGATSVSTVARAEDVTSRSLSARKSLRKRRRSARVARV